MITSLLQIGEEQDINSPISVVAIVLLGVVSVVILFVAPVLVGAMIDQRGYSESQAGAIISIELLAMSIATFPALWWSGRVNWRKAIFWALLILALSNVLSSLTSGYTTLLGLRLLSGVSAGSSMALCLAIIGMTRDPDRVLGFWVSGQLTFGALGLFFLPSWFEQHEYGSVYLIAAVPIIAAITFVRFLPEHGKSQIIKPTSSDFSISWLAVAGFLSIFVFYIGQYGIWAFFERLGVLFGLTVGGIGNSLAIATIAGIFGALATATLSTRYGRFIPIAIGACASIVAMLLLFDGASPSVYLLSAIVFSFCFNFVLPYLMACLTQIDQTGRVIMLSNVASGAGLAVGPVLAGYVLQHSGHQYLIGFAVIATAVSVLMVARLALIKSAF